MKESAYFMIDYCRRNKNEQIRLYETLGKVCQKIANKGTQNKNF